MIQVTGKQRRKDGEFDASLCYIERSCLQITHNLEKLQKDVVRWSFLKFLKVTKMKTSESSRLHG